MATKTSICLYCGKPIRAGRSDKKFCSSAHKDAYYNALKSEEQQEISKIDGILKRNRRILKKLFNPKKPEQLIAKEVLIKEGFEFGFHTHVVISKTKANEFIFCYDYGYREVESTGNQIVKAYSNVKVKGGGILKI